MSHHSPCTRREWQKGWTILNSDKLSEWYTSIDAITFWMDNSLKHSWYTSCSHNGTKPHQLFFLIKNQRSSIDGTGCVHRYKLNIKQVSINNQVIGGSWIARRGSTFSYLKIIGFTSLKRKSGTSGPLEKCRVCAFWQL